MKTASGCVAVLLLAGLLAGPSAASDSIIPMQCLENSNRYMVTHVCFVPWKTSTPVPLPGAPVVEEHGQWCLAEGACAPSFLVYGGETNWVDAPGFCLIFGGWMEYPGPVLFYLLDHPVPFDPFRLGPYKFCTEYLIS